jgi:hypothetical protein
VDVTDVRNTSDSAIQMKTMGKNLQIDPNSSVQLGALSAKNCGKPLKLKLDARAAGDRDHYALDYNDGVVKPTSRHTQTGWGSPPPSWLGWLPAWASPSRYPIRLLPTRVMEMTTSNRLRE